VELPVVADDVIEMAEHTRQQQPRIHREERERSHGGGVIVEVERDKADWGDAGPGHEIGHSLRNVADDYLGRLEPALEDLPLHLEVARLPDIRHVAIVDWRRHP